MNYVVIMAGGKGTRLWPLSRNNQPKQLQNLIGKNTMIQDTFTRIKSVVPIKNIYISTNENYKKEIQKQLPQISKNNYIVEPCAKDTAPAIGLIAAKISKHDPNAIISTIASDHIVKNKKLFSLAIKSAQKFVLENKEMIGTIGLKPTFAHTGLGYIEKGKKLNKINGLEIYKVNKFKEKPNEKLAKKYLQTGNYFWNASYFTFNANSILEYFNKFEPEIFSHLLKIQKSTNQNEKNVINKQFKTIPKLAIDYLVEKIPNVFIIPVDLGWDDVGSWKVLKDIIADYKKNVNIKRGNLVEIDNTDSIIYAQNRLIATIGLDDIVIVDTPDATLICNKNRSQDVKQIVEILNSKKNWKKYL